MSQPTVENLVARVEHLERENRRLKRIALAAASLVAAGLLLAPAAPKKKEPPPKPVKTSEVQVVDDQGATRISLKIEPNGDPVVALAGTKGSGIRLALAGDRPVLSMSDETRVRAVLDVGKDLSSFDLEDARGERAARLQAGDTLGLFIDDGKTAGAGAALIMDEFGPSLTLALPDETGASSVTLQVSADSGPLVSANRGQAAAKLDVSHDGDPSMTLSDAEGHDRAVLGVTKLEIEKKKRGKTVEKHRTDPSSLVLFDAEETVVWKAP